jgi:hypothetical protein
MNRKQMLDAIEAYYKSIGRKNPPAFRDYSNAELKLTIRLFNIV